MNEAPKVEVHLVPSGGAKWGGIGECGTATIAPAVANAISTPPANACASCRSKT
jgi:isoquinoline 1-oxidoreductase beta subunit